MRSNTHFGRAFAVLVAGLLTTMLTSQAPAFQGHGQGRVIQSQVQGTLTILREAGPRLTVDYTATRVIRLLGRQIVIDVISAGIVRETGAAVTFDTSVAGVVTSRGERGVGFSFAGTLTGMSASGERVFFATIVGTGLVGLDPQRRHGVVCLLEGSGHDRVSERDFTFNGKDFGGRN